ncbi:cell wall metabolism sensor histidine kinase WalK [Streptomyces sp. 7-21]|jgi:two-component system sensor histidine kinase MprB|uniref:sensor histidine kinase n=1 Tax=Streptomyces sp. 7-21 TaxID=2802283 RepID=UPI00191CAD68|nr:HAMP domain-containing sensor histidine kinase [Streptomyces sp. 7-21]MBL1068555.1 HAMP domain-containing histidine kinase [Streptomyces sp. 7-21]
MGRFSALPLRTRLALLTAVAVALAVAVCAVVAWILVRQQLTASLDEQLRKDLDPIEHRQIVAGLQEGDCRPEPREPAEGMIFQSRFTLQVVWEADSCIFLGAASVTPSDSDIQVANRLRHEAVHNATGSDGETYRVLTRPLSGTTNAAVSIARPLDEVTDPLRSLALVLTLVAAAGVVGSAGVGVALARAGLRPVDRLTEAAEHIARTEDLSVRIPVHGDDEDEIARLTRAFNSMTAALASSRELQQQLIADAGHELRTPLTSLRTNIELLARSEATGRRLPEDDRRRLLESVTAQMKELAALIGDLQELSRPEPGPGRRLEVVALHDVTRRAVARARLRAGDTPVRDDIQPWYVRGEAPALERAVVNLLDNAVKFGGGAPEGVTVELRGGVLRVRDHGPGIPAEELPHVFERFWRSPGARSLPGSGLGLSIVARTVRSSGGDVVLRPAPGGGTEAVVTLPGAPTPPPGAPA